jgi:asparagine synthase (glutamine-hydrolysing)
MCGIWGLLGTPLPLEKVQAYLNRLLARGPEGHRILGQEGWQLGFTRLAINGLTGHGMQPMCTADNRYIWVCNGEIYNWRDLAGRYGISTESGSDCEVLGELLQKSTSPRAFFRSLDGVFSILVIDTLQGKAYVGRDPYGIRPLFVEKTKKDTNSAYYSYFDVENDRAPSQIFFSSELKALPLNKSSSVKSFPPGHYAVYDILTRECLTMEAYHTVPWLKNPALADRKAASAAIRIALEEAVKKRMMTERPVAALLSGGLDSSLIAALVQRELKKAGVGPLKTFSIGFEGSEDLRCARLVADHIGSDHHEIVMEHADFLEAIPAVIRDIESFDITTVRASVGNWLISREIRRRTECKVVFNGDGSDEVFGGYLYFYKAPSDEAFEEETSRLLEDIHLFDVLRSDRSISSHGLEARTPFLDKQFVAVVKSVATALRRPVQGVQCEKQILREAFSGTGLLPDAVLWRKKEAFSDGVSGEKSWYQICQEYALEQVPNNWADLATSYSHLKPKTAEAYYYRTLFEKFYSGADKVTVPYHWMPRWSPGTSDPSARTLDVYTSKVEPQK